MNSSTLRRNLTKKPKEPTETPIYRLELIDKNQTQNTTHHQIGTSQPKSSNQTEASENNQLSFDDLGSEFTQTTDRKPSFEHEALVSVMLGAKFGAVGERRVFTSSQNSSVSQLHQNFKQPEQNIAQPSNVVRRTSTDGSSVSSQPAAEDSFIQLRDLYGNVVNFPTASGSSPPHRGNGPRTHHRRNCCSFCYGLAKTKAEKSGRPVPAKDDEGEWSNHSIMVDKSVTCPTLYKITCGICGATKENAHTTYFCPFNNQKM